MDISRGARWPRSVQAGRSRASSADFGHPAHNRFDQQPSSSFRAPQLVPLGRKALVNPSNLVGSELESIRVAGQSRECSVQS